MRPLWDPAAFAIKMPIQVSIVFIDGTESEDLIIKNPVVAAEYRAYMQRVCVRHSLRLVTFPQSCRDSSISKGDALDVHDLAIPHASAAFPLT
jgi:hypothetical protein